MLHARDDDGDDAVRTFTLHLQEATRYERIDGVESFIGRDRTGSFGILAGHARMMTALGFGLARFRKAGSTWEYLALPGGLLYMVNNELFIGTRRYLRGSDAVEMSRALEAKLLVEEEALWTLKESLRKMEEALFRNLWRMKRVGAT
jgi:F-type H+-transporting ATPase subunit epsilon